MPTVNQLIKKPRSSGRKKAKSPALRFRYNSLTKKEDAVRRCSSEGFECEKISIEKRQKQQNRFATFR